MNIKQTTQAMDLVFGLLENPKPKSKLEQFKEDESKYDYNMPFKKLPAVAKINFARSQMKKQAKEHIAEIRKVGKNDRLLDSLAYYVRQFKRYNAVYWSMKR